MKNARKVSFNRNRQQKSTLIKTSVAEKHQFSTEKVK